MVSSLTLYTKMCLLQTVKNFY